MKKAGFTLAEVLITLMILGIIAALTIPSLIQNTQKKEQVVQLKKGMSMFNQAITMNYALNQEDLKTMTNDKNTTAGEKTDLKQLLKDRLAVTTEGTDWVRTQDGLTYLFKGCTGAAAFTENTPITDANCTFNVIISTLPPETLNLSDSADQFDTVVAKGYGELGKLNGIYGFNAGTDRLVPTSKTAGVLYAKNATSSSGS